MDLREYKEQPTEGMYERIEATVRRRRVLRVVLPCAAAVVVATVAVAMLVGRGKVQGEVQLAAVPEIAEVRNDEVMVSAVDNTSMLQERKNEQVAQPMPEADEHEATDSKFAMYNTGDDEYEEEEVGTGDMVMAEKSEAEVIASEEKTAEEKRQNEVPQTREEEVASVETEAELPQSKAGDPSVRELIEENEMWAPNAIVPNGDVDKNRMFGVQFAEPVRDFVMSIYNRRGQQLFSTTSIDERWDAKYNGIEVPQGGYTWVVKYRGGDGKMCTKTGTVTVIR